MAAAKKIKNVNFELECRFPDFIEAIDKPLTGWPFSYRENSISSPFSRSSYQKHQYGYWITTVFEKGTTRPRTMTDRFFGVKIACGHSCVQWDKLEIKFEVKNAEGSTIYDTRLVSEFSCFVATKTLSLNDLKNNGYLVDGALKIVVKATGVFDEKTAAPNAQFDKLYDVIDNFMKSM